MFAQRKKLLSRNLRFLIIIVLTFGVLFRLINLSHKVYWGDETFTSLRISGYTMTEVKQQLNNNKLLTVDEIKKYQNINSQKNLTDTILGLATEEPQLPPLYFLIARTAVKIFGNSIAIPRAVSAFLSLLTFPCVYWLALELFGSVKVGWIAMAITAVSPLHVLYAQEARPYSLWTVTVLLSSAIFLRAIKLNTKSSWALYLISIILGLYSFLLSVLVIAAHGLYLFIINSFRFTKTLVNFLITCSLGLVAYLPWVILFLFNYDSFQKTSNWALTKTPLSLLINEWIRNISYSFMDFWYYFTYYPDSRFNLYYGKLLIPLVLILTGLSLYTLIKKSSIEIWLFILALMITNVLPMVAPDLINGGYRSIMARYFIPCYIGIQLSVAYLFTIKLDTLSQKKYKFWQLSFILLIIGGIISCAISSQQKVWWNKRTTSHDNLLSAQIINQKPNSVIITNGGSSSFTLSYLVNPETKFLITSNNKFLDFVDNCEINYFLISGKKSIMAEKNSQRYKIQLVRKGRKKSLWQLKSSSCQNTDTVGENNLY